MPWIFKNPRLIFAFIALSVISAVVLLHEANGLKTSACGLYRNDKTVQIGSAKFEAEVADTANQQEKGLGRRPCIGENQAMLFEFSKPSHYAFWMKDMKFPIDIVWISPDHRVADLNVDVQPSTYPNSFINKDHLAQYVLEIKANRSKSLSITLGTPVNF